MNTIEVIDYNALNVAEAFTRALKDIGFAVIANSPVRQALIDEAYRDWYAFFNSEEKQDYAFDPKTHAGFISQALSENAKGNAIKDIKEFYHYFEWGPCPENLKQVTQALYSDLKNLARTLLQWIDEKTPEDIRQKFSMPLSEMIADDRRTLFRLIHYPPLTGHEPKGALRAAAHGDINLITLLTAASAEGLEVLDKKGQWLPVPHNANWIVVNVADMLQEATDHYYPSTQHRVVNPMGEAAKQSRLSMPLFLHPADDVKLSDRYTAESYRRERFEEIGLAG
ncbi:MAG: 2OG-Fe(II) oxygenase [Gammaproteobacteria bacterium RIFCSPHIGHO2_12_FULL_41_15]|nr:MAG: 2OG-Fe(II) oxygenase [Gammaproteobacteria bacterium RIFCSPHIGHO2_12_FULL_41_15]